MPARFWLLRIAIGVLCVTFAFFWGRAVSRRRFPAPRGAGSTGWAIRTLASGAALLWGTGTDLFVLGFYLGAGLSFAAGLLLNRKPPKPPEDLSREIFPEE
jgi:hypothetical protein